LVAKRPLVAQVLSYAACLYRRSREAFDQDVASYLERRGHADLAAAIQAGDQEGSFDLETFRAGIEESLRTGRLRLVIVLDDAPPDLVRLVGYLQVVAEHLLIDLVTVSAFEANGQDLLVPQRLDPGTPTANSAPPPRPSTASRAIGFTIEGSDDFAAAIEFKPPAARERLRQLCDWADALAHEALVVLSTCHGKRGLVLLPRLKDERVGLATVWTSKTARSPCGAVFSSDGPPEASTEWNTW
jgi:hypothetical protein